MTTRFYESPIGTIRCVFSAKGISELKFVNNSSIKMNVEGESIFRELSKELDAYFSGSLEQFSVPIISEGTSFQRKVWSFLPAYGHTMSYAELACCVGQPGAVRAVANANAKNPCMILVPCHRVIGSDSSLTGYAGGLIRKGHLIGLEKGIHQASIF